MRYCTILHEMHNGMLHHRFCLAIRPKHKSKRNNKILALCKCLFIFGFDDTEKKLFIIFVATNAATCMVEGKAGIVLLLEKLRTKKNE